MRTVVVVVVGVLIAAGIARNAAEQAASVRGCSRLP
jgi:hypothetical protein